MSDSNIPVKVVATVTPSKNLFSIHHEVLVFSLKDYSYRLGVSDLILQDRYYRYKSGKLSSHASWGVTVHFGTEQEFVNRARMCIATPENESKLKVFLALSRQIHKYRMDFLRGIKEANNG